MSILLEFSMFPTDRGESVSLEVSKIIEMIRDSGYDYRLTAMGTIIETANIDEALGLVEKAYHILAAQGCQRIFSTLKLDIRHGKENRLMQKIQAIESKIGKVDTQLN